MENNNQSEEEKLKQTIKYILKNVYNSNLLDDKKDSENIKKDIEKFQNETKEISFEKHLIILKILIDNIYEIVNNYKEKILQNEIIIEIKKKYDKEIKNYNNLNNNKQNINENNKNFDKFYLQNVSIEKITTENSSKKLKDGLDVFLYGLRSIKLALIESGETLEKIFKKSLEILKEQDGKPKTFDFILIHKQVYNDIILDNFIQLLLIKLKNEFKEYSSQIYNIQEDPLKKFDEMTKFKDFVNNEINTINNIKNESDFLDSKIQKNLEHIKHIKNEKEKDYIITPVMKKITNSNSNNNISNENKDESKINNNNKEIKYQTLDQLLNFINNNNNEENKVEKGKKKKNKKRKKNNENNEEKDKNNEFNIKEEKFIEEIKNKMKEESCNKKKIRKIKPRISKDWLKEI